MDITYHLTANFYPPIPHDIQLSCQSFFDKLREEAGAWYDPEHDEYFIDNEEAFDQEWTLPNGVTLTGQSMMDQLRLWDALYWEEMNV
jgi:hypothetical protein